MNFGKMVHPTFKIIAAGTPPIMEELNVEVGTNMVPGRLVKKGTSDSDIIVNTLGNATISGWLDFEHSEPFTRPADISTAYEAGAKAMVVSGGGFVILGKLAAGQNVAKDANLAAAADGMLKAAGAEDVVVATAKESVDATAGATNILVTSVI